MDLDQIHAWAERQELRHELDGMRISVMAGGTGAHAAILRIGAWSPAGTGD